MFIGFFMNLCLLVYQHPVMFAGFVDKLTYIIYRPTQQHKPNSSQKATLYTYRLSDFHIQVWDIGIGLQHQSTLINIDQHYNQQYNQRFH